MNYLNLFFQKIQRVYFTGLLLFLIIFSARSQTITGKVQSEGDNQPLSGVTIHIKGTTTGTTTNDKGQFKLSGVKPEDSLIFSFVGFNEKTMTTKGASIVNVKLSPSVSSLNQVVVVGYGTQKKINLTGSVSTISNKEIENRPFPNVGATLAGLSPNLDISLPNAMGGEPGAGNKWEIRGLGSINGNASPLILVDGVEMNIQDLNPDDIESVNILKDASASAIYGARAAFGVILITTKKGKSDGKPVIKYNGSMIIGSPLGIPHYKSSLVYATAVNEAAVNAGSAPNYPEDQLDRIKGYINGTFPYEYDPDNPPTSIWEGRRIGNANYDFPYYILKEHKVDYKHNINIRGGTEKTQYYASLGSYDQGGFYRFGYDEYKRYNILANINTNVTDWLSFGLNTKYAKTHTDYPIGITTVGRDYAFSASIFETSPLTPIYNIDGTLNSPNISNLKNAGRDKNDADDFLYSLRMNLEPLKGWNTTATYNYNIVNSHGTSNPKPVPTELGNGGFGNAGKPGTAFESIFSKQTDELFNVVSSYEKSFSNHNFKILLGYEQEYFSYKRLDGRKDDLITEEVPSISTAIGATTLSDRMYEWALQSYFGRLNYNYKHKYLLELSGRYDGSSRFSPDSRWGFFPSGSVGYNISEESFWKPIKPYVNFLKIRASYGSLGNQDVSNYLYISAIPIGNETPWIINDQRPPYANVPAIISSSLTWETVATLNYGLDMSFLNERLSLNFDFYNRKTTDMMGPQGTLPFTLGASTPKANNASMKTQGFELTLNWKDNISNKASYFAKLSIGDSKSVILNYKNENGLISDWYEGKQVGEIWGFVTDHIIQSRKEAENMLDQSAIYPNWGPGDIKYKDINGDGKITAGNRTLDDHGDLKIIGNSSPRYHLSILGGINWNNFDFNMQWNGIGRRNFWPNTVYSPFWGIGTSWSNTAMFKGSPSQDYWRPTDETNIFGPNTNAYLPKPYASGETTKNRQVQTRYLLNAAYLRLRYFSVGYTIPSRLTKLAFINNARVYISGSDLLTIDGLPQSIDPIQGPDSYTTGGFYPVQKSFTFGINLSF